jgi:SagB-type dehydrogenase family enzyme
VKLRTKKVMRSEPFPRSSSFNPWTLAFHSMDTTNSHMERVGAVTNQLRFANRHFDIQRDLGEFFLTNTRARASFPEEGSSISEYFSSFTGPVTALSGTESIDSTESISLPDPHRLNLPLSTVLERRESVRRFSGDLMELEDLATILHACAGVSHTTTATPIDGGPDYAIRCHNVPSAGGLYAVDCYSFVLKMRHLKPAVYKYLPYNHSLARLHSEASAESMKHAISSTATTGIDPDKLAVALVFVGNPQKAVRKYGARGVRYILLEAGMMAFSANLAATALGYGTLDYQSFMDDEVEKNLSISLRSQYPFHMLLVGWPVDSVKKGNVRHD